MGRRNYSDKEKADVLTTLKANGDNILQTSNETGVPITTIWNWTRNRCGMNENVSELGKQSEEELSTIFERVARKYLSHAETDLAVTSTYGNIAVQASATATDKMLLLRGQSTDVDKVLSRLVEKLQGDLPDIPAEELRAFVMDSIEQKGTIG